MNSSSTNRRGPLRKILGWLLLPGVIGVLLVSRERFVRMALSATFVFIVVPLGVLRRLIGMTPVGAKRPTGWQPMHSSSQDKQMYRKAVVSQATRRRRRQSALRWDVRLIWWLCSRLRMYELPKVEHTVSDDLYVMF